MNSEIGKIDDVENIDYKNIRLKFVKAFVAGNEEEAQHYLMQCPIDPELALVIKEFDGIEALEEYNLVEAKKAYPSEF